MSFDDQDDVIDSFSSLHHSIAIHHAEHSYEEESWRQFYDSLELLFSAESILHEINNPDKPTMARRLTASERGFFS